MPIRSVSMQGQYPEQRVGLFVDTQNLYYTARDYYQQYVNYQTLIELASQQRQLRQATAYVVERPGDHSAHGFVTKLSSLGYRVRRRHVQSYRQDDGRVILEGDWDMGIAADMVRAWDYLDVLVLASGDGDFVPMLEVAQQRGKRIEILAFRESCSQTLLDLVDAFTNLEETEGVFV